MMIVSEAWNGRGALPKLRFAALNRYSAYVFF